MALQTESLSSVRLTAFRRLPPRPESKALHDPIPFLTSAPSSNMLGLCVSGSFGPGLPSHPCPRLTPLLQCVLSEALCAHLHSVLLLGHLALVHSLADM